MQACLSLPSHGSAWLDIQYLQSYHSKYTAAMTNQIINMLSSPLPNLIVSFSVPVLFCHNSRIQVMSWHCTPCISYCLDWNGYMWPTCSISTLLGLSWGQPGVETGRKCFDGATMVILSLAGPQGFRNRCTVKSEWYKASVLPSLRLDSN